MVWNAVLTQLLLMAQDGRLETLYVLKAFLDGSLHWVQCGL